MAYILLVEDNQANADMILHILMAAGHEVRHALRGLEGAKAARERRPDLILMDINLPDIDGRTITLMLKKQLGGSAAPPIVACSARSGPNEKRIAAAFGCAAYLSKPFTPDELLRLVNHFLDPASPPIPPARANDSAGQA